MVWLSRLHMYLSVNRDQHTYTHTHSSIFYEKGADEQRKCASGVDSEVAAWTGKGAAQCFAVRPPPACPQQKCL